MLTAPFKNVVMLCGAYSLCSTGYVAGLLAGAPLWIILIFIGALIACWCYMVQGANSDSQKRPENGRQRTWIVCIAVTIAACIIIKAHGAYDAWLQWNALARYMSSAESFRYLHLSDSIWHAEYPPGLPATIGMIWRVIGNDGEWVPRSVSFLFFLAIPVLLCDVAATVKDMRYLWLAVPALFLLNFECLSQGLNQYADVPLSVFLLLSFMLLDASDDDNRPQLSLMLGVTLGGCLIMKNEGQLVVGAFLAANARRLLYKKAVLHLIPGLAASALCLLLYKRFIPEGNDLLHGFDRNIFAGLLDADRYKIIGYYALRFTFGRFPLVLIFFAWALWKLYRQAGIWRSRKLHTLLLCIVGYLFIYLTHRSMRWLVPTTLNRLMMQLLPAAVYGVLHSLKRVSATKAIILP